ncbi:MAG: hypothetical protein SH847_13295 [Roseiflexaceae bacterium]|nr:hypothetical protein [Roseiflexaceae bacterium]
MLTFCTYFDIHYLRRGLALYTSLQHLLPNFKLWVLCLDAICYSYLAALKLPNLGLVSLEELERAFPCLLDVKQGRTRIEYYFTCTPFITQYVANNNPNIDMVTYLDADIYFFADPQPIFDEMQEVSIGIIEHRYHESLKAELDPYGIYNVGLVSFRCDTEGLACLQLWCDQCLDWCYDRLEGDRYADQKYLEQWPKKFDHVRVIQHKGANVAPWNFMNYAFRKTAQGVFVDEQPLIFFHFHGFKKKASWLYDTHAARYGAKTTKAMRKLVVEPYIYALMVQDAHALPISHGIREKPRLWKGGRISSWIHRSIKFLKSIINGQQVVVIRKRVIF